MLPGSELTSLVREAGFAVLKERLSLAGGQLHIDSEKGKGTRVTAWVGMNTEAA